MVQRSLPVSLPPAHRKFAWGQDGFTVPISETEEAPAIEVILESSLSLEGAMEALHESNKQDVATLDSFWQEEDESGTPLFFGRLWVHEERKVAFTARLVALGFSELE